MKKKKKSQKKTAFSCSYRYFFIKYKMCKKNIKCVPDVYV